jgi:hypothetical protein
MIAVMNKLKANFMRAIRRLIDRGGSRDAMSAKAATPTPRHPLFGALKGFVRVMPGTDLTKPADPAWGSEKRNDLTAWRPDCLGGNRSFPRIDV